MPDLIWNEDRVREKVMPKDALTPQARHRFTRFDQVNQLVGASEADADLGFMARMMAAFPSRCDGVAVVAVDRSDAKITVRKILLSACIVHAEWIRT